MTSVRRIFLVLALFGVVMFSAQAAHAVSEKAQRFFDRGTAAIESASGPQDFRDAAGEFQKAAEVSPDWPDPYYNAGVALEKAGDPTGAAAAFRKYLKAAPQASDAKAVQQKINKLEYLAEKQAKNPQQALGGGGDFKTLLKSLDGAIFRGERFATAIDEIRIKDGVATYGKYNTGHDEEWLRLNPQLRDNPFMEISSQRLTGFTSPWSKFACRPGDISSVQPGKLVLSQDGQKLTEKWTCSGQERIGGVFYKQD